MIFSRVGPTSRLQSTPGTIFCFFRLRVAIRLNFFTHRQDLCRTLLGEWVNG